MLLVISFIVGILSVIFILTIIWDIYPFKILKPLCHDILKYHLPDDKMTFDGASMCSHCRFCGKEIMQDSQGNWF